MIRLPLAASTTEPAFQDLLNKKTGIVQLAKGTYLLHSEVVLPADAHDLTIDGRGAILKFAPDFNGRAAIVASGIHNLTIAGIVIEGNRAQIQHPFQEAAAAGTSYAHLTRDNGILAEHASGITIQDSTFHEIAGFPILIDASEKVTIRAVTIMDCGSLNPLKRNNATGGILLEEGTHQFEVSGSTLERVLGNGIWTRSLATSQRNQDGVISGNKFEEMGRDAIQIGNSTRVTVSKNTGSFVGYPAVAVDRETQAAPVAIATVGDTDRSKFEGNAFTDVNGECLNLDGFHDGEARNNSCINNEDRDAYPNGRYGIAMSNERNLLLWGNRVEGFLYGGLLLTGSGHQIRNNHFVRLNLARCNEEAMKFRCLDVPNEPDLLRSGIYLRGDKAHDNLIENNEMTGFGIGSRCVVTGPGADAVRNRIGRNTCSDDAPVSARVYRGQRSEGQANLQFEPAVTRVLRESFAIRRAERLVRAPKKRRRDVADDGSWISVVQ